MRVVHLKVKANDASCAFASDMHGAHCAAMNIKRLRQQRGWSQRDLADKAGWDQSTIQRAEALNGGVRLQVYLAIADAFGVTLQDLFSVDRSAEEARILSAYRAAGADARRMWDRLASDSEDPPQSP